MENKSKHTPGPWYFNDYVENGDIGILAKDNYKTNKSHYIATMSTDNADANARLIAAAPELLEALELSWSALMKSEQTPVVIEALNKATEVIRKAKGE